jgi:hypothetical protein
MTFLPEICPHKRYSVVNRLEPDPTQSEHKLFCRCIVPGDFYNSYARVNGSPATIRSRADQLAKLDAACQLDAALLPSLAITAESLLGPANRSLGLKPSGPFVFKHLIT